MKKPLYLLSFGLAMALTVIAQNSGDAQPQGQSAQPPTQNPPVTSTTPANQVGSGAQTKAGTPSTATSPAGTQSAPATGGVAGAASSSTTQPATPQDSPSGIAAVSDSDLEVQIQNALNKEPTLTGDSTHVKVAADSIELDGNVGTNKEKTTATRIVQSYAGSRKLVNRLTVGNRGSGVTPPRSEPQDQTDHTGNPANTNPNPATNPEPNKGSKPPR